MLMFDVFWSVPLYVDRDHELVKLEEAQITQRHKVYYMCNSCKMKVRMNCMWQMLGIWLNAFLKGSQILQWWGQYKNLYTIKFIFQTYCSTQWGPLFCSDFVSGSAAYMFIFLSQQEYLCLERMALSSQFCGLLYGVSLLSMRSIPEEMVMPHSIIVGLTAIPAPYYHSFGWTSHLGAGLGGEGKEERNTLMSCLSRKQ